MRIRTIKPEFWNHRIMARLGDFERLLALACLSMADDEGYFWADPMLIRAACFPFTEDSLRIHGGLITLSKSGWISLFDSKDQGKIGLITNFKKHQKINRATDSKIKGYVILTEDSLRTHGGLMEDSPQEQGTGNREQGMEGRDTRARAKSPDGDCSAEAEPHPLDAKKPRCEKKAKAKRIETEWLKDLWNEKANPALPRCSDWTTALKRSARARIIEHPEPEYWERVIEQINLSPFCLGNNGRGWRANIDFLLRPDSGRKILEGQYDSKPGQGAIPSEGSQPAKSKHPPATQPPEITDRARGEAEKQWPGIYEKLAGVIDAESFGVWFEDVRCEGIEPGELIVLSAPNDFARNMILNSYDLDILEAAAVDKVEVIVQEDSTEDCGDDDLPF